MPVLDPDLTRVVVGDVHGDPLLIDLLQKIGVINSRGERAEGFHVVQIGDLAHFGHRVHTGDTQVLELALRAFDQVLLGNHEAWFAHRMNAGKFAGMHDQLYPETEQALQRLVRAGHYQPAAELDGWVITHAGVHPVHAEGLPVDPALAAAAINQRFAHYLQSSRPFTPMFDAVGPARGGNGRSGPGGMLWLDLSELTPYTPNFPWPQIVGHTPQAPGQEARAVADNLWVVDAGAGLSGRLSALVKPGADADWQPLVVHADPDRLRQR